MVRHRLDADDQPRFSAADDAADNVPDDSANDDEGDDASGYIGIMANHSQASNGNLAGPGAVLPPQEAIAGVPAGAVDHCEYKVFGSGTARHDVIRYTRQGQQYNRDQAFQLLFVIR